MEPAAISPDGPALPIPHWPGRMTSVGEYEIFLRSVPEVPGAEPALCVHGLGGSSTNWTDLMDTLRSPDPGQGPALAAEALDLPGYGHSPLPASGDYSISAEAAVVARVIEKRGRGPVHLIGNSLGGAICTRLAARRPELTRTLTLISPALPDLRLRLIPARVSVLTIPRLGPWLMRRAGRLPAERRVDALLRDVYYDPSFVHPSRIAEEIAELERMDGLEYLPGVLLKSARSMVGEYVRRGGATLWRDAATIRASVLALYGSHDRLVDPRMAARAARTFPDVRVVVLPRTGHVAMLERPHEVAREMWAMMAQAAARQPVANPSRS
ncbi:MAG TPA: alpha/beta hydrolase [Streptosporangiaceae bacterium]|nr:alpha/beta hydrolase [Streptosporangiaceae bacterium]